MVFSKALAAGTSPTTAAYASPGRIARRRPVGSVRTNGGDFDRHSMILCARASSSTRLSHPWPSFDGCKSSRPLSSRAARGVMTMTANEMQMKEDASRMARAAIRAVRPDAAVRDRLRVVECDDGGRRLLVARADDGGGRMRELAYDLSEYDSVKIVAFGKASAAMALASGEVLSVVDSTTATSGSSNVPSPRLDGVAIIKDGHATEDEIKILNERYNILVRSASHPVPDARSVSAATEILDLASSSDSRTLIVACISGGGSALFCSPRDGLTLDDLMAANRRLLESGMPIERMNVIRKRLENGKGGRLATSAYPATVLALVLSDIIGDPLDLIASGPTVPDDGSCWDDARALVDSYGLNAGGEYELPTAVLDLLSMGKDGKFDDTPKSSHSAFSTMVGTHKHSSNMEPKLYSETILVGNNDAAVLAAAEEAAIMGYNPVILGTRFDGEAACVGKSYISMAEMISRQRNDAYIKYPVARLPVAFIAGGETVVTLPPNCTGKGGRNQELALSAAMKMREIGLRDVVLASVGTDGTDGPTDAAGAIVHGGLVNEVTIDDARNALKNHDAYNFLKRTGSLMITGPTGTNVADICITLVK
ncbi:hypothetical protein ACHAXA_004080 [Cyclostephanos tholiformis]|uniref:Glycerate kinase n=1 Tax=Cyclostephanos tholiformis TaxID=382380 RepID=A0ABD3RFG5_9STRA